MAYSIQGILAAVASAAALTAGAQAQNSADHADLKKYNFEHVSCSGAPNEIRVLVDGVKDSVGLITADLYPNDEEAFLKGPLRVTQVKFAARSPMTKFCITAPEKGPFAIALYHDKNANGRFDKGPFGMPAEPWGISNNPKVLFSAPPVEKALFDVEDEGARLEIQLN